MKNDGKTSEWKYDLDSRFQISKPRFGAMAPSKWDAEQEKNRDMLREHWLRCLALVFDYQEGNFSQAALEDEETQ